MKLEWPILTSTCPLELFRPITIRFCRIRYSSSRPSSLAITPVTSWSGAHCTFVGLPGMDLSACSDQSVSDMIWACFGLYVIACRVNCSGECARERTAWNGTLGTVACLGQSGSNSDVVHWSVEQAARRRRHETNAVVTSDDGDTRTRNRNASAGERRGTMRETPARIDVAIRVAVGRKRERGTEFYLNEYTETRTTTTTTIAGNERRITKVRVRANVCVYARAHSSVCCMWVCVRVKSARACACAQGAAVCAAFVYQQMTGGLGWRVCTTWRSNRCCYCRRGWCSLMVRVSSCGFDWRMVRRCRLWSYERRGTRVKSPTTAKNNGGLAV